MQRRGPSPPPLTMRLRLGLLLLLAAAPQRALGANFRDNNQALKAARDDPSGRHTYSALWLEPNPANQAHAGSAGSAGSTGASRRRSRKLAEYRHVYFGNGTGQCLPEVGDLFTFVDYEAIARENQAKAAGSLFWETAGGFFRSLYEPMFREIEIGYNDSLASPLESDEGNEAREAPPSPPGSSRRSLAERREWTEDDLLAMTPEQLRMVSRELSVYTDEPSLGDSGGPHDDMIGRESATTAGAPNMLAWGGTGSILGFAHTLYLTDTGEYMCIGYGGAPDPSDTFHVGSYPNHGAVRVYQYKGDGANIDRHSNGPFAAGWEQLGEDIFPPSFVDMWKAWSGQDTDATHGRCNTGNQLGDPNKCWESRVSMTSSINRVGIRQLCSGISYNPTKPAGERLTVVANSRDTYHPRDIAAFTRTNNWVTNAEATSPSGQIEVFARGHAMVMKWDPDAETWSRKGQVMWGRHAHSFLSGAPYLIDGVMSKDGDTLAYRGTYWRSCDATVEWECDEIPEAEENPPYTYSAATVETACHKVVHSGDGVRDVFTRKPRAYEINVFTYDNSADRWRRYVMKSGDTASTKGGINAIFAKGYQDQGDYCPEARFHPHALCDDGSCIMVGTISSGNNGPYDFVSSTGDTCHTDTDAGGYLRAGYAHESSMQVLRRASVDHASYDTATWDDWTPDKVSPRPAAFTWNGVAQSNAGTGAGYMNNYPIHGTNDYRHFISSIDGKLGLRCEASNSCAQTGGTTCASTDVNNWMYYRWNCDASNPARHGMAQTYFHIMSGDGKTVVVLDGKAAPSTVTDTRFGGAGFDSATGTCGDIPFVDGATPVKDNGGFEVWQVEGDADANGRYTWGITQIAIADVGYDAAAPAPAGAHEGSANAEGLFAARTQSLQGRGMYLAGFYYPSGRGASISSDGSRMIVGAHHDASTEWVGNLWAKHQGSAFAFVKDPSTGLFEAKQKLEQTGARASSEALFGQHVAMSGDGTTVAISAPRYEMASHEPWASWSDDAGLVEVWRAPPPPSPPSPPPLPPPPPTASPPPYIIGAFRQIGFDMDGEGAGDYSGFAVATNGDGTMIVVGAYGNDGAGPDAGHVRIYQRADTASEVWTQLGADIDGEAEGDYSGFSVAMSTYGRTVAVGAYRNDGADGADAESGHVRVYDWSSSSNTWVQRGGDLDGGAAGERLAWSVGLSGDGLTVVAGYISGGTAVHATSTDADAEVPANTGGCGVQRWTWSSAASAWSAATPIATGSTADATGFAVAVNGDGTTVAIGAPGENGNAGCVKVWQAAGGGSPTDVYTSATGGDLAGFSVALDDAGTTLVVGAPGCDSNAGKAYTVARSSGGSWGSAVAITPTSTPAANDEFGIAVATNFDGQRVAVGAHRSDGSTTAQGDDEGHTRLFHWSGSSWSQYTAELHASFETQTRLDYPSFTVTWDAFLGPQRRRERALTDLQVQLAVAEPERAARLLEGGGDSEWALVDPSTLQPGDEWTFVDYEAARVPNSTWQPRGGFFRNFRPGDTFGDVPEPGSYEDQLPMSETEELEYLLWYAQNVTRRPSAPPRPMWFGPDEYPEIEGGGRRARKLALFDDTPAGDGGGTSGGASGGGNAVDYAAWVANGGVDPDGDPDVDVLTREDREDSDNPTGANRGNGLNHGFGDFQKLSGDGKYLALSWQAASNADHTFFGPVGYYGNSAGLVRVFEYKGLGVADTNLYQNGPMAPGWEQVGGDIEPFDMDQVWQGATGQTECTAGSCTNDATTATNNGDINGAYIEASKWGGPSGRGPRLALLGLAQAEGTGYPIVTVGSAITPHPRDVKSSFVSNCDAGGTGEYLCTSNWRAATHGQRGYVRQLEWTGSAWVQRGDVMWGSHPKACDGQCHYKFKSSYAGSFSVSHDGNAIAVSMADDQTDWSCSAIPGDERNEPAGGFVYPGNVGESFYTKCSSPQPAAVENFALDIYTWDKNMPNNKGDSTTGNWRVQYFVPGRIIPDFDDPYYHSWWAGLTDLKRRQHMPKFSLGGDGGTVLAYGPVRCHSVVQTADIGWGSAWLDASESSQGNNHAGPTTMNYARNDKAIGDGFLCTVMFRRSYSVDNVGGSAYTTWTVQNVAPRPAAFTYDQQDQQSSSSSQWDKFPIHPTNKNLQFISTIDSPLGMRWGDDSRQGFHNSYCDFSDAEHDAGQTDSSVTECVQGGSRPSFGGKWGRHPATNQWGPLSYLSGDGKTLVMVDSYTTAFGGAGQANQLSCYPTRCGDTHRGNHMNGGFEVWKESASPDDSGRYTWEIKQIVVADAAYNFASPNPDHADMDKPWHPASAGSIFGGSAPAVEVKDGQGGAGALCGDGPGRAFDISYDGSHIIIGCPQYKKDQAQSELWPGNQRCATCFSGAAFVFEWEDHGANSRFVAKKKLWQIGRTGPGGESLESTSGSRGRSGFGTYVGISDDGKFASVTAPYYHVADHAVYGNWNEDRGQGIVEVWYMDDGVNPLAAAAAGGGGAAASPPPPPRTFDGVLDGSEPGDRSGRSLALSGDGKTVVVGAPLHDGDNTGASDDRGHVRAFRVAPDLPGNTLVSELTTAMVGSATAYADSTSASCGEGTTMQSGQCAIDCGYTAPPPPPPPLWLTTIAAVPPSLHLDSSTTPELVTWNGWQADKDWAFGMTQDGMAGLECGIFGFQYADGHAYAIGWGSWGWSMEWTNDKGIWNDESLGMHVRMTQFCSSSACDFDWVLSYDGSSHRSGTGSAPDITDFTFFTRDRNGDGAWHAQPTATTSGCSASGTDVLCYYGNKDQIDRHEADSTTLTWSANSGMTAHFNERFDGYHETFTAPTNNACPAGWTFKQLRFSNDALELQDGELVAKAGSTGRRLSDGADGAADGASRGWRDRDPLEDAVAAVGRLLAKEPEQAAPLFLHLEPMLEAALSEDA